MAGQITPNHHFNLERLGSVTHSNHWVRRCEQPIGDNVLGCLQEMGRHLIEDLALVWNSYR